jgi:hypothetical protein
VFSVTAFTALLGNVFQQWTVLCSRALALAGWRTSHTNLLLFSQNSFSAIGTWSTLYSLCTNLTDNICPKSFSIVAWRSYRHGPHIKHRFPQLSKFCVLHSRYLAMVASLAFSGHPQYQINLKHIRYECLYWIHLARDIAQLWFFERNKMQII